jgi:hypothetical protein
VQAPDLSAAAAAVLRLPDLHGAAQRPVQLLEALQVTLVVDADLGSMLWRRFRLKMAMFL